MKKFILMMLLTVLMIIGNGNQVEASDYYVGHFRVSRAAGYIMTETIRKTDETTYEVTLKAVFPNGQVQYIYYTFDNGYDNGQVSFINSDGNDGIFDYHYNSNYPVSEKYPVEYKMFDYIFHHR